MKKLTSILSNLRADDLLRHVGILFSGMMVVHVCNMVFQMAVIRVLPKEEYALLVAFLAVLAIIARPLGTLRTGVSHYSSLLRQDDRSGDVKRLIRKWIFLTGLPAVVLGVVTVFFNRPLAEFLHLNRSAPVLIAGAVLPALFWFPILIGAAQGLQLFKWGTASVILGALIRLGLGAGFVWFLYPACGWAMVGHGMGLYTTLAVLLLGLFLMLRGQPKSGMALPSMRFYLLQSFFVLAAYAVLFTADVILVKHYLPEDTEFAVAATIARMVAFLPGAIVTAMFPKVVSRGTTTKYQRTIFFRSFGYTALFVVMAVVGCSIFSDLLARIFGIADVSVFLKRMIGVMSLVMGFAALLNVTLQFLLAQRRFAPTFATIGFAVLYLVGAWLFHDSSWQVVAVAIVCNAGALLTGLIYIFKGTVNPTGLEEDCNG